MELGKRSAVATFMAAVLMGGMVLAGCDDNVEILRDPDIHIAKGMTWAWRPMTVPAPKVQQDADSGPWFRAT